MSSWKAAESRIGSWFGAKGIKNSGRVPLSGGSSGSTRSDSPHRTIFIESKRDKTYLSAIKLWKKHKRKSGSLHIQMLPEVSDGKVVSKQSELWCFHNSDFEKLVTALKNDDNEIIKHDWVGNYPSVYSLYHESVSIKNSTLLDYKKEVVCCALVYHGSPGFWIVIDKNDITKCWKLILEEREFREKLIQEEKDFKENK